MALSLMHSLRLMAAFNLTDQFNISIYLTVIDVNFTFRTSESRKTEAFVAICEIQTLVCATVLARKRVTLIYVLFTLCSFKSGVTLALIASNLVKTLSMFTRIWLAIIDVDFT